MPKIIQKILLLTPIFLLFSCDSEEAVFSPKPRGYYRIDFPSKSYRTFDSICPFAFDIPTYSQVNVDRHKNAEPCWYNIDFPQFKATIHLSYKQLENDLGKHLESAHYFANKHQVKATGLEETVILRDSAKVYGLLFDIAGNTASSLQFYLTDSSTHFLRGALYFNAPPNIDSLKIVIDFLKTDVLRLINTARWKAVSAAETPKKKQK